MSTKQDLHGEVEELQQQLKQKEAELKKEREQEYKEKMEREEREEKEREKRKKAYGRIVEKYHLMLMNEVDPDKYSVFINGYQSLEKDKNHHSKISISAFSNAREGKKEDNELLLIIDTLNTGYVEKIRELENEIAKLKKSS